MFVDNRLLQATINSFLVHLLFFGGLHLLKQNPSLSKTQQLMEKAVNIERISPQQLRKYRTVGVKGGSKNFQLKTPKGSPQVKKDKSRPQPQGNGGELSFSNLQAKVTEKDLPPPREKPQNSRTQNEARKNFQSKQKTAVIKKEIQAAESGVPLTALRSDQTVENFRRQESIRRNMMKEMGTKSTRAEVLKRTGFNLHFEPPEGVSEDELNSVEKIFYSFQKRTFTTYVTSFLSTYQQKIINKPQLRTALQSERHLLTGKVDFDKEGNILRIKILRSSPSDEVHQLFEETLKGIGGLPNPPKALVEKREQFTIYYQLNINY